jgi:hypothetical protein
MARSVCRGAGTRAGICGKSFQKSNNVASLLRTRHAGKRHFGARNFCRGRRKESQQVFLGPGDLAAQHGRRIGIGTGSPGFAAKDAVERRADAVALHNSRVATAANRSKDCRAGRRAALRRSGRRMREDHDERENAKARSPSALDCTKPFALPRRTIGAGWPFLHSHLSDDRTRHLEKR